MDDKQKKVFGSILVLMGNVILFCGLIIAFFVYDNGYKQKLYNQNLDEISNINQASANIASSFFESQETKLRDLALYIEKKGLSLEESLDYIYHYNSNKKQQIELIGADGTGYVLVKDRNGNYETVNYTSGYGAFCAILKKSRENSDSSIIQYTPEFTDAYTALKSFASYNSIQIRNGKDSKTPYTMLLVSESADFIKMMNINSGYDKLSTIIMNRDGDYIIGNGEFKSNNFFDFLDIFNELSLDQKKELQKKVNAAPKGHLTYKDGRERECVYVYTPVDKKDWLCVSAVPTDSFRNGEMDVTFALSVACIMLLLLILDMSYLYLLNRKLKISIKNERIANAAKTDFLSRMSHDMRTLMNGIIGMTRLTQDIKNLPTEVSENLLAISDSSAYLLQLINDILDMSKIESNKFTLNPETVNAKKLMEHIISTIKPLAEQKDITLEVLTLHTDLAYIVADRVRLQQVFLNILSNAVKFTPKDGRIKITVECLKREEKTAYDRIVVEDSGCGMSEEFLKHIFEPFSQEQTRIVRGQEGTGLGMAIVKNLVELMGGKIEIESTKGVGTKISIFMEFHCVEKQEKESDHEILQDASVLDGKKVLLAEDHPLNATIVIRLLEKKGMCIDHAQDGEEAVRIFEQSPVGYYDVILMDIRMPNRNGLEASKMIRKLLRSDAKEIPIIAMTANAYAEDVKAAKDAGMNVHLAKPIEPDILYRELIRIVSNK